VLHAYSDHSKAQKFFPHLIKSIDVEEGISKMAKWVKTVGPRTSKSFKNIEILKNLPSNWKNI
jgi:hypothetical protein